MTSTGVPDGVWRESWSDVLTDYTAWEDAGHPDGYVWGVNWMAAYPGAKYVRDSAAAADWSARLGRPMHEVLIETNGHRIRLVFHDLSVHKIGQGDPMTREVRPIEPARITFPG